MKTSNNQKTIKQYLSIFFIAIALTVSNGLYAQKCCQSMNTTKNNNSYHNAKETYSTNTKNDTISNKANCKNTQNVSKPDCCKKDNQIEKHKKNKRKIKK